MFQFCTSWKYQKTKGFLTFSGIIKLKWVEVSKTHSFTLLSNYIMKNHCKYAINPYCNKIDCTEQEAVQNHGNFFC